MLQPICATARRLLAPLFLLCLLASCLAEAQPLPVIANGVQWLSSQVQADGSVQNETQSIATPMQSRAEVAQTLQALSSLPASLAGNINAITENNTQYLARKIIALSSSGIDTSAYVTTLTQRQNPDGGFGGAFGYTSDPINTAWVVLALAQISQISNTSTLARTFLVNQIGIDGGIFDSSQKSRIYDSAIVLLALETTPDNSNATAISGLNAWLKLQQGVDGSWSGNTFLTAYALLAVGPVNSDATVNGSAGNFLLSKQAGDGSWNDDPYLTAIVLRALTLQSQNTNGLTILQGQIVDGASNLPLYGASITLAGSTIAGTTDNNGNFSITGLPAGLQTLGIASPGYSSATRSVTITGGQTSNTGVIALTQIGSAAIVRGQITSAGGAPLAGVAVVITGAGGGSGVTDASGHYTITGVTPGAVTITASLTGYQTATGTGTLVAGQSINFAPTLYPNGQTPSGTIQYTGTVVAAGSSKPLSGVTVQVAGSGGGTVTTGANGQFSVTLSAGSYSANFSLTGYTTLTQNFIAPAGSSVNVGIVSLTPILTSSTVTGQVFNASNQPVSGATVQIVGTAVTTTTAADGSYTLANISGTAISIRASATGLDSQTVNLQFPQPANVTQNFNLAAQTAGSLSIGGLTVAPASGGSNTKFTVSTVISNSGPTAASAVLQMQVINSSGKLIGLGTSYDANGNQTAQVNVTNGQPIAVNFVWNSAQFAPDTYTFLTQLVQVGSITRATPQGIQMAQSTTTVTVTGQAHFSGTVSANPPVLQSGTNTPVQITATIQNDGNIPLPAQAFTLSVVNTSNNTTVQTLSANGVAAAVKGLQTLSFPSWTPTVGGNFSLVLTAADPTLGTATGTLYVGDSGSATYTTNKLVVPTGTQTVRGTVNVLGQNVANGTISDPLAPLIKTAVQSAINYGYTTATADTISSRCTRCHVQSQALVGGELTSQLTNYVNYTASRNTILNALTTTQQSNGSLDGDPSIGSYAYDESLLAMWALNSWHKVTEVASTLANGARYLESIQNADGTWTNDYTGGWWDSIMGMTSFNVKNLIDVSKSLSQVPAGTAVNYSTSPLTRQGVGQWDGMAADAAGNVYAISRYNGTVTQIKPDGTSQVYMTGLNNPFALVFASDGTAYVASYGGLYHRNADGSTTQISSRSGTGLAIGPDGNFYMSSWWDNKISKITPSGVASDYIVGGALNNPLGIAFTAAGDLLVANYNSQNVLRYHADLTQDVPVGWTYGGVYNIQMTATGWMITTDNGLFFYNNDWHGQRLLYTGIGGVTATPDGTVLVGDMNGGAISKLVSTPIDIGALQASMATSISNGTTWLLQDANVSSTNNMQMAQRLIGLTAASNYYQGQPLAQTLQAKMVQVGAQLRANVNTDGGWGLTTSNGSDSLVTAQVGFALDALNPSASDPIVQNAVKLILGRQHADGTWYSEDGIMGTPLATTTWVSIWLPIVLDRLGGIDTDLSVTFPSNVTMANPDTPPVSVTPNSDGSNTALWHLTGVTSAGQTVNYDLTLSNMAPGEVRAVSTDAHLTFNNSFTNGKVNAPIAIPQVTASAFLGLGVTTDRQMYPANALVNITGQVTNTASNLSGGSVKFDIYAPDNTLVTSLGSMPFNNLAAGASSNLGMTWNTGMSAANSGYFVQATLFDSRGALVGSAKSVFGISSSASGSGNSTAGVTLTTDKQIYLPTDTVNLSDRLTNLTANNALNNLNVVTSVTNAAGTLLFSKTETLPQLPASAFKNYAYAMPLNFAAAGVYNATVQVTSAGSTVAQAAAQFTVASSANTGSGLIGKITLSATQISVGDPLTLSFTASDNGNSALTNVPLTLSIIDPVAQKVIASYPTTQTLAVGATYAGSNSWNSIGPVGNSYVAVLSATIGSNTVTLAQSTFTVIAPPIKLGIAQGLWNSNRVLVLTECTDHDDWYREHGDHGHYHDVYGQGRSNDDHENHGGDHDDDHSGDGDHDHGGQCVPHQCTAARYVAIDQALTGLGLQHQMTTNVAEFTFAMRSGLYDTLWIAGDQSILSDALTAEVSEVVHGGASLIVDGAPGQCNANFDWMGGIRSRHDIERHEIVNLNGSFYPAPQSLPTSGRAQALDVGGSGQIQGVYSGSHGHDDGNERCEPTGAALVSNTVGAGRTLIAGFDLGRSLAKDGSAWTTPAGNSPLGNSFASMTPKASTTLTPGQVLPLQTTVANQANAVTLDVQTVLPSGTNYLVANPVATFHADSNTVEWNGNLAVAQSDLFTLLVRAPATAGAYDLQTTVATVNNGNTTMYGNVLPFPITVTPAADNAANAITMLQGLKLATREEQHRRDELINCLKHAMYHFDRNTYSGYHRAIYDLIDVARELHHFGKANATVIDSIHGKIDAILQEAQWRWTLTQPEIKATLDLDQSDCRNQDTVTLTDVLKNVSTSRVLSNLSVVTTINNASGALVLSNTESLKQLEVGEHAHYSYQYRVDDVTPGVYHAAMIVTDADGNTLAQMSAEFTVREDRK